MSEITNKKSTLRLAKAFERLLANKKSDIQRVIDVFKKLAQVKSKPDLDPFAGKHLNVILMGQWADKELPDNFLGGYLVENIEHVVQCEKCRDSVVYFKARRQQ